MKNFKTYLALIIMTLLTIKVFATKNYVDILSESRPIIIENAKENTRCFFKKGNINSFEPYDEVYIKFSKDNQLSTYLKNKDSMQLWGISTAYSLSGHANVKVTPGDCAIILERIFNQINSKGQLVLPGLHKFSIYDKTILIEAHYATLNLGEPLHNNPPESMLVSLGSSIYINFNKNIPTDINNFSYLSGRYTGSYKFHPRAASDLGLNCIPSKNFQKVFSLVMKPTGSNNIVNSNSVQSSTDLPYDECMNNKNKLFQYSEQVDPQNHGEVITANQLLNWNSNSFTLRIHTELLHQDIVFLNNTTIFFK